MMNRRRFIRNATVGAATLAAAPVAFGSNSRLPVASFNDASLEIVPRIRAWQHESPEAAASDEDFWAEIRRAFTIDTNQINLNSGSVSPAPRIVQEAERNALTIQNMSPSLWVDEFLIPQREILRTRLAALFGCDREEMAITRNTTESLEIAQFGLPLKAGDEVLTTTQDYPSMLTAYGQRARRDGITLKMVPFPSPASSPDEIFDAMANAIGPRTKVLHFSHVTYTAGQIFPVQRLCQLARSKGLYSIVDGAHAFAHFPFNGAEFDCDVYGASLHKWLTAPFGTGLLYVRKGLIPTIWPLTAAPESLNDDIRKFEQIGTAPVANRNAIGEAITFHEAIGADRKAARLRFLRERWMRQVVDVPGVELLTPDDPIQACALGTMRINGIGANELTERLQREDQIHVRPRFVPNEWEGIRVTPNVFSTIWEVDTFAAAVIRIAKSLP